MFDIKAKGIPNSPLIVDIPIILPIPNKVRKNNTDSKLFREDVANITTLPLPAKPWIHPIRYDLWLCL